MNKWTWMITVVTIWVMTEYFTSFVFGWAANWDHFGTVVAGSLIAVWTFPTTSAKDRNDG